MLIGEGTGPLHRQAVAMGWGRMWIARDRNIYTEPGEPWGLDNGAFRDWREGISFDGDQFRAVLDKAMARPEPPYLAVVPDAPGDAVATYAMAEEWLPELPAFPWYLALQDGMTHHEVDRFAGDIVGVLLGGTNAFKAEADQWREYAHDRGLRFHYGRCGTLAKVAHAIRCGADSLDSAFPMWTQSRWNLFVETITSGPIQQELAL